MKRYLFPPLIMLFSMIVFFSSGCQKRDLAPGGVYQGNQITYVADNELRLAHEAIKSLLEVERANRAIVPPAIIKAADDVRKRIKDVEQAAVAAIDVYRVSPTTENADKVSTSLKALKGLLASLNATFIAPTTPVEKLP